MKKPKIIIGEKKLVALGPKSEEAGWGYFQFPKIVALKDGKIGVRIHTQNDSPGKFGSGEVWYVSDKDEIDWQKSCNEVQPLGTELINGDRLLTVYKPPISLHGLKLMPYKFSVDVLPGSSKGESPDEETVPEPLGVEANTFFRGYYDYSYLVKSLPKKLREQIGFYFLRSREGGEYLEEKAELDWPYMTVRSYDSKLFYGEKEGHVLTPPSIYHVEYNNIKMDSDGTLWLPEYRFQGASPANGAYLPRSTVYLFSSDDNGHSWKIRAHIPFYPDMSQDKLAYLRDGFTEPALEIAGDGTMVMLLRTCGVYHGGPEWGPVYITRSHDKGITWTTPEFFSPIGALPQLLRLKCGTTLAVLTRPGIFVRASHDNSMKEWMEDIEIMTDKDRSGLMNIPPAGKPTFHQWAGSCCNATIMAISNRKAILAYSDFYCPDLDGTKHKGIYTQTIEVIE